MEKIEANQLINRLSKDLGQSGIVKDVLVTGLKELREFALEEGDPTVTKVLRLAYEHIDENGTFNIPIPEDEVAEGQEEIEAVDNGDDFDAKRESLDYLFSLLSDSQRKANRVDIMEYRDALLAYDA